MATFHPSIMGSDEACDCEYQIVTACDIDYDEYLLDYRILKRAVFEQNFEEIVSLLDIRNPVACQVLGVITLRTGSYFPEHYKDLAIKFSELRYDKTDWKEKINIRKIYLKDFREKVRNHIADKKSHLIRLQMNHDNELKFTSIGFTHFIDLFNKKAFNRIKHINLDSCNLSSFPTNILSFQLLESLSLNNNYLDQLPSKLTTLHYLKSLSIRNNSLQSLPDTFGDLHNLEFLDLTKNNLIELPNSFSKLHSLKKLYLANNPVKNDITLTIKKDFF